MLHCKDVAEKASDYIDKELPLKTRLSIKIHLFMCYKCNRYVEQLRTTIKTLAGFRNHPTDTPDEKVSQEVIDTFRKQKN